MLSHVFRPQDSRMPGHTQESQRKDSLCHPTQGAAADAEDRTGRCHCRSRECREREWAPFSSWHTYEGLRLQDHVAPVRGCVPPHTERYTCILILSSLFTTKCCLIKPRALVLAVAKAGMIWSLQNVIFKHQSRKGW